MNSSADSIGIFTAAYRALSRARKPRAVLQSENAECGLACLAIIANHYGYDIDLVSLRQRHPLSSRGLHLLDLIEIAGELHLTSRALRAELDELDQVQLPCILHWGTSHFVVLSAIKKDCFVILDPACGERRVSLLELGRHFSGALLELGPTSTFQEAKLRRTLRLTDLWTRIEGLWPSLGQILVLSLILQMLTVIAPLYTQAVVDHVIAKDQWSLLTPIAIGFGLLVLTQSSIGLLRSYAILHLSNRLNVQMGANLFYHLLRLPLSYFLKRHTGDVLSRFQSLHRVRQTMTTGIVSAWLDGLMAAITVAVMLYYSVLLATVVICMVVLYALFMIAAIATVKRLKQEQLIAGANESSHFMETVRAIQTLKIFQKENDRQGQWLNKLTALVNKDTAIAKWEASFAATNGVLFGLENIAVIYLCAILVRDQQMSLGMMFAFLSFKISFTRSMTSLITQGVDFLTLDVHLERISDVVFTDKEAQHRSRPNPHAGGERHEPELRELKGTIEVRDLAFRFEGSKRDVFRHLSFRIEAGETVAITGPSGCGKTTLLKCLMGLLEPTAGTILIDGVPLQRIGFYRSQIAAVMQDDQLISGSIKDNIAFFAKDISMERVRDCATMACIHDEIVAMPMQYETLVGDLGSSLSGGQKQRVILARAICRTPRILFMDEATSHLDVASEAAVNEHISRLAITRVLVAHRPETVRTAGKRINMADRN